ncbi:TIGR04104 family putative zinc finger protein [Planococcus sp. 1R117A]|uniref:TIGR04104 family putative zinc finger protein n=1 Tax=Planococcus sp. 1R117A TaxID=3447020 RepID=UPI003EDBFBB5
MPKCTYCDLQWSWKQTIKKMFTLNNKLECPVCGKTQYISRKSKKRLSLLNIAILLPLLLNVFASTNPLFIIALIFSLFLLSLAIMPFLTIFSDKEEPMW